MVNSFFQAQPQGYWPRGSILDVMTTAYDRVEYMEDDDTRQFYQVELRGLKFLAVLINADDEPEKIIEFGFMAYFSGFDLSQTGVEALNRNLHISVVELDERQNLLLFAFLVARGAFDQGRFALILEAWHRDIVMTLKMIVPGEGAHGSMSTRALELVRSQGANVQPEIMKPEAMNAKVETESAFSDPSFGGAGLAKPIRSQGKQQTASSLQTTSSLLKNFLGEGDASRRLCQTCEGRGRTGFPVRNCMDCEGSGLTAPKR